MEPYYRSPTGDVTLYCGDAAAVLRALPAGSVHTCITSPPYWGLRDYSVAGQLGLEETPVAYVAALVAVFAQVWRVLRDDGTLWLNLGDSYASPGKGGDWDADRRQKGTGRQLYAQQSNRGRDNFPGLKAKDLCGVPWRVAFALQDAGWTLRSDIIWSKPNPMPESVRDRPTRAHEYVFLLSKGPRYFYDATAIAEATTEPPKKCGRNSRANVDRDPAHGTRKQDAIGLRRYVGFNDRYDFENPNPNPTRNRRSVWEIATEAFPQSHFATFPIKLVEPMLLASTSARGCCPACGAPWVRANGGVPASVLGEAVRAAREARGLTREQLAAALGKGANNVWDWEVGGHIPRGREWDGLAGALGLALTREQFVEQAEYVTTGRQAGPKQRVGADDPLVNRPYAERKLRLPPQDLGWRAGCACGHEPVACVTLDPFCGSGTVGLVARKHGRHFVGIDLSAAYLEMARERLGQLALPLMAGG